MSLTAALDSGDITRVGVGVIVVIIVVGVLLTAVVSKLLVRALVLIVAVVLAVIVWQQRTSLQDDFAKCRLDATFFGVHFDAPHSLAAGCRRLKH